MEGRVDESNALLVLAMRECLPHQPDIQKVTSLRTRLTDLDRQIDLLQQAREAVKDEHNRGQMRLEQWADVVYSHLAEASPPGSGQEGLLSAILYVKAELEHCDEAGMTFMREHGNSLLATPIGTPVVYLHRDVWYGGRTSAVPHLYWDGDEWWLQFPMVSRATGFPLEALMYPDQPGFNRNVCVGEEQVRERICAITQKELVAWRDMLSMALASAGLDGSLLPD